MRRRIRYHRHGGGPEVPRSEEFEPGRGQAPVRVCAAAADAADRKIRNGELRP